MVRLTDQRASAASRCATSTEPTVKWAIASDASRQAISFEKKQYAHILLYLNEDPLRGIRGTMLDAAAKTLRKTLASRAQAGERCFISVACNCSAGFDGLDELSHGTVLGGDRRCVASFHAGVALAAIGEE
jgi:hypothetical protein